MYEDGRQMGLEWLSLHGGTVGETGSAGAFEFLPAIAMRFEWGLSRTASIR